MLKNSTVKDPEATRKGFDIPIFKCWAVWWCALVVSAFFYLTIGWLLLRC